MAARDFALFSLGRFPESATAREPAEAMAARLHAFLDGARVTDGEVGRALGINPSALRYAALDGALLPVRSPLGDEWLLAEDEPVMDAETAASATRLLPSGDAYFLLADEERELLVPDAERRRRLWTSRVWPGALLVDGGIRGTWRRAQHTIRIETWGPPGALVAGRRRDRGRGPAASGHRPAGSTSSGTPDAPGSACARPPRARGARGGRLRA